jgi:hypothetical protein
MASRAIASAFVPDLPADGLSADIPALGAAHEPPEFDAARPLRLDRGDGWWLIESGQLDLFAVALEHDEPVGIRHSLCRLSVGELIASFCEGRDHTVIAVAHPDTVLRSVAHAEVATWPIDRQAALIDGWLTRIAATVFGNVPSCRTCLENPATFSTSQAANGSLHRAAWPGSPR